MRLALIVAFVLSATSAFAQAPMLLYVSDARPWDPSNDAAQIDYALPSTAAIPSAVAARVDGGAWVSLTPSCDASPSVSVRWCHLMTPAIKAVLDVPGVHRVQLAVGVDASPDLVLRTPTPQPAMCPYTTLAGVSDPKPVNYRMGAKRAILTDADSDAFAKRVGQLEDWGFRVTVIPLGNGVLDMTARCFP